MLSIVTGLLIAVSLWRARRERYRLHALILLCPLILLDGVVYYRSGSSTSLAATAAGLVTVTLWAGIAKWRQQTDTPVEAIKKVIYPTFVGFALLVAWVGFRYQEFIMRVFGKADFFNGRSALWHFSWTGFLERPIIGWGWRVAWSNPEFLKRDLWWTTSEASWSHNGFLEVLLGGGIVGGLLFVAYVLWAGREMVAAAILSPIESWRIGIAIFVLVACTQEVFIIGNHFLWLMFVAVLTPSFARQQVQRQGSDFPQQ
jgi:O-antigen ligase